jgi:molybdenum cofactor synthesis domain-containing protein
MARRAGIILIGNEILSGKIRDSNAHWLCSELRALGVDVQRISVIPDDVELIAAEVARFCAAFDVVFTSGGVGPTHDDVTMEGVAKALRVPVVRDERLVTRLRLRVRGPLNEARLRMAEIPEGADLVGGDDRMFPTVLAGKVYVLPGVPEIFRAKFEALRERFRDTPFHLVSVFVDMPEGTLADYLNELLGRHPGLLCGSYPEFSNPEYKVKVTLESKDRALIERAAEDFVARLPREAVVRVQRGEP